MFPTLPVLALAALGAGLRSRGARARAAGLTFPLLFVLACAFLSRIRWEVGGVTVRLEQLALLLLAADTVRRVAAGRLRLEIPLPAAVLAALFPLMLLSSAFGSIDPGFSLRKSLAFLPYAAGLLAVTVEAAGERFAAAWDALWDFGAAAAGLATAAFLLFYAGLDLGMVRYEFGVASLRGTIINPNLFGSACGLTLVVFLHRIVNRAAASARGALFDHAAAAVAGAALIFSATRAAWIVAGLGALAVLAWGFLARRGRELVRGAVLAAAGILFALAFEAAGFTVRAVPKPGVSWGEFGIASEDMFWKTGRFVGPRLTVRESGPAGKSPRSTAPGAPPGQRLATEEETYKLLKGFSFGHRLRAAKAALADWRMSPVLGRGTDAMQLVFQDPLQSYIPVMAVQILHDWGIFGLAAYLVALAAIALALLRTAFDPSRARASRDAAWIVFLIVAAANLAYQVSSALPVSMVWILLALGAAGASALRRPAAGAD